MREPGSIPADPGVVLAQVGRELSEIGASDADGAILRILGWVGPEIDLSHVDIWRHERPSGRSLLLARWSDSGNVHTGPSVTLETNERLSQALAVGGGTAVVPRRWVEDHTSHVTWDVESSQVVVSIIDREMVPGSDDSETTVLLAAPTADASLTLVSSVISDLSVQLKQFNRRVRGELAYQRLLRIERTVAEQALAVTTADDPWGAVAGALEAVRAVLGASALTVAQLDDDDSVLLLAVASPEAPVEVPFRFRLPTMAGIDVAALLRERFAAAWSGVIPGIVADILGPESADVFGQPGDLRAVATLPAGGGGRLSLGATRGADRPWTEAEMESLSTFAALIGQTRERVLAQGQVERRAATDRAAQSWLEWLDRCSIETVNAVIAEVCSEVVHAHRLDALAVRWVDCGHGSAIDAFEWRDGAYSALVDDDPLLLDDPEAEARLRWGDEMAYSTVPVIGDFGVEGTLVVAHPDDGEPRGGLADVAAMFARTESRLRSHMRERYAAAVQQSLSAAAIQLGELRPADMLDTLERVLTAAGTSLGFDGLTLITVDHDGEHFRTTTEWAVGALDQSVLPFSGSDALRRSVEEGSVVELDHDETDGLPARLLVPAGAHGRVDHVLVATLLTGHFDPDSAAYLTRLATLITQAIGRLEAEQHAAMAFDFAPTGVLISDRHGAVLSANQAVADLMALETVEPLIGTRYHDWMADPDETVEWRDADEVRSARIRLRQADGSWWTALFEIRPIAGTDPERWLVHVSDVTARDRVEAQLRHAATHDSLTGLPNRRALRTAIEARADRADMVGLVLLDLDRFKNVNDSLGHDCGDKLLLAVADRLRLAVRPDDLVVRLGGDEFGILLGGSADAVAGTNLAERVLRVLDSPVTIDSNRVYLSASIGIAVQAAPDPEGLVREADVAMYRSKDAGGGRFTLFDEALQATVDERHRIETGLRSALAEDRIEVAYQPEVDLITGETLGAEALVRWRHPDDGLIAAGVFIEVAEQAGLIHDIGQRVLDLACAEAASWPGGPQGPKVRVNLSADQLHRDDLIESITRALATHGLAANRLCLEVTESAAMRDVDRSLRALHELRELGVELAVDDFGTGYSSLAYLKRFPFHTLKIDRTFVNDLEHDPEDVAFVGSIVYLARSLGLEVVAEGIESEGQADALRGLGCTRGQGFYFAKPAPAAVLRARLGVS